MICVAEAGSNHGGSVETACEMVSKAAQAGADSIKFQKRDLQACYTRAFLETPYNSEQAYGPTYGAHREALELSGPDFDQILYTAEHFGIEVFSTAFDPPSVDFCVGMGFPRIKIASGDLTNTPLLAYAKRTNLPLVVSTGAATYHDVDRAYDLLKDTDLTLLHCVATYPTAYEDLNLRCIEVMKKRYPNAKIGVSLHTNGPAMGIAAAALGAEMCEMHFTLDRTMKGTDHAMSLEPQGLAYLCENVRRLEVAMGDGNKRFLETERPAYSKMGKAIIAKHRLEAGHIVHTADLDFRSPGEGLPPWRAYELVGRRLHTWVGEGTAITEEHLSPLEKVS